MIDKELFARHVKDALGHLYDPVHLQVHPLAELLTSPRAGETAGEALRKLLWDTIAALQPAATVSADRPEWLSYRLLWSHYVQALNVSAICAELNLSERSFYRRLQDAVEAVVSILWARLQGIPSTDLASTQDQALAAGMVGHACEEALRLARQSRRQAVDIGAVLESARDMILPLAVQQGITLRLEAPASIPGAYGDPAMFHQIILNILTESLGLAATTTIELVATITAGEAVCRLGELDVMRARENVIEQAEGLTIGQALLQAYGGRLWVERNQRGRSILCFALPVAQPRLILIIDDDASTINLYRRYLQAHHYGVREAFDAQQVETQLTEAKPDIILLDVLMPGQDGWKLLQRLKTQPETSHVPVVICSVLSQPRLALALGAAEVLQKPITEEALLQTLERILVEAGNPVLRPPT